MGTDVATSCSGHESKTNGGGFLRIVVRSGRCLYAETDPVARSLNVMEVGCCRGYVHHMCVCIFEVQVLLSHGGERSRNVQ